MLFDIIKNRVWPNMPATKEVVDNMISKLENGFRNDYEIWKDNIANINSGMLLYVEKLGLDKNQIPIFTYDEFCISYLEKVKIWLASTNLLDEDAINLLLYEIILDRIDLYKPNDFSLLSKKISNKLDIPLKIII